MDLSKKRVKKIFKALSFSLFFVLIFIAFFSWSVKDSKSQVTSCDFNNIGADNMINITSSCQITKDTLNYAFSGPSILAPIVVKTGAILTIGSQASLVLAPGQQLYVDGGQIIIDKNSDGSSGAAGIGALLRGSLYLEDSDGDNYPDSDIFVYDTGTSNTITSGETTYIKSDPANFNITAEEGIIVDCDPYDPNVFESVDCVLSEPSYGQWQNVGYCGEYVSRVQRRQRTWTKTVITEPACDGAACGTLTGIEVDDSMACGVCNPGDVTTCGEGVCTNSVTCNSQSEYPTCVENSAIYWYDNDDGDAYGDPNQRSASMSCTQPAGYIDNNYDCDDSNSSITTSGSRYRYSTSSVSCNESCASYRQTQTCSYGVWNGSYTYSDCSVNNCSSGQYCNGGTCTTCTAGYYCIGDNTRKACGSVSKYSPSGRSSCLNVSSGYYTTGGTTTTRTGQSICPAGSYCVGGIRDFCSAGTYTSTTGNTSCTSCPAGTCSGVGATSCYSDTRYYRDADGDGYGNPSNYTDSCSQPSGYVSNNGDCDDGNASVYQGSTRTRYACASVTCGTANVYETQTCQSNGTWSGSYTLTSPCSSVSSRTRYSTTQTCGSSCLSQLQTCQSTGAWTGTYTNTGCTAYSKITIYQDSDGDGYGNPSVTNSSYCSYNYPSGWATNNDDCDDSRYDIKTSFASVMYNQETQTCGTSCDGQYRTCSNGSWDSYTNYDQYTCTASTRTRYSASQVCGTSCSSQTQTCQTNGAWSGTYTSTGCTSYSKITVYQDSDGDGYGNPSVTNTNYCSYNYPSGWKTNNDDCDDSRSTIKTSYSGTMYNSYSVSCGDACASRTRTCSNGVWDSYTNYDQYSCTASTRTRYSASQVCGTSCSSQTQTCQTNGAWSGTYAYSSCSSQSKKRFYRDADGDGYGDPLVYTDNYCSAPSGYVSNNDDCDDDSYSVKNSYSGTLYMSGSVACGTACEGQYRTCSNGVWTGDIDYMYYSCTASTRVRWNTSIACDSSCYSQTQVCQMNGTWSGTYGYTSCSARTSQNYYRDVDGDGYGNPSVPYSSNPTCLYPTGYVTNNDDCDDSNSSIKPGSTRTRYKFSTVSCSSSCQSETQTCSGGEWSGSFTNINCSSVTCGAGYYCDGLCVECTAGYRCPVGNSRYPCLAGTYSTSGSSTCTNCPNRTYSGSTASSCTLCPSRSYNIGTGNASCPHCQGYNIAGFSYDNLENNNSRTLTKPACYRAEGGKLSITITCNNGTISYTGSADVPTCYSGYTYAFGDWYKNNVGCYRVCVLATCTGSVTSSSGVTYNVGTMNHNTTATKYSSSSTYSCSASIKCSDGSLSVLSESCSCASGSYGTYPSCNLCPPGSYCSSGTRSYCYTGYSSPAGSDSSSDCFTCGAGYYASNLNTSTCSYVGTGYYSPANNILRYACTPGHYCPSYANSSMTNCPAGTYSGSYYNDSVNDCSYCSSGTYSYAGYSSCSNCSSGYTSPTGSDSSGDCFTCGAGYYSSNNSTCVSTGRGYYSTSGDYRRYGCRTGTYQPYYNGTSEGSCKLPSGDYYSSGGYPGTCKKSCPGQTSDGGFQYCMTNHYDAPYSCYSYCYGVSGTTCYYY